jgi:putative NADH-flavin reductase
MSTSSALIWGAGGAIGCALQKQLGKEGWQVTSIVHNPDQQNGSDFSVADAGDPSSIQTALIEVGQPAEQFD